MNVKNNEVPSRSVENSNSSEQLLTDQNDKSLPSEVAPHPKQQWDYCTRILFNSKNTGMIGQFIKSVIDYKAGIEHQDRVPVVTQVETVVDSGTGLILAVILHCALKGKYHQYHAFRIKNQPLNPTHAKYSTSAKFGATVGNMVSNLDLIPVPAVDKPIFQNIASAGFNFGFGMLAIGYDYFRNKYSDKPPVDNPLCKVGTEGWVSYAYAGNQLGTYLGQPIGAIVSSTKNGSITAASMYLFGSIAGVSSFLLSIIAVPFINWLTNNRLIGKSREAFRINYAITGLGLGSALGSVLGFLASLAIPGLGVSVGMMLCGALGSVAGFVTVAAKGGSISKLLKEKYFPGRDTENSWDYTTRSLAGLGGSVGGLIGFFIPVPGGAAVGALLGGAIGTAIGWFGGIYSVKKARELVPIEQKSKTLSWSQWVGAGNYVGSALGMIIGLVVGLMGGPLGVALGVTLGAAIGGVLGGVLGAFVNETARYTLKRWLGFESTDDLQPSKPDGEIKEIVEMPAVDAMNQQPGPKTQDIVASLEANRKLQVPTQKEPSAPTQNPVRLSIASVQLRRSPILFKPCPAQLEPTVFVLDSECDSPLSANNCPLTPVTRLVSAR